LAVSYAEIVRRQCLCMNRLFKREVAHGNYA